MTEADYRAAGERSASSGLPTVIVQEGGYDLPSLGTLVTGTLAGLAQGAARAIG